MRWTLRPLLAVALSFCLFISVYLMLSTTRDKSACPQAKTLTFDPHMTDSQMHRNRELAENPVQTYCIKRCLTTNGTCCTQSHSDSASDDRAATRTSESREQQAAAAKRRLDDLESSMLDALGAVNALRTKVLAEAAQPTSCPEQKPCPAASQQPQQSADPAAPASDGAANLQR